MALNDVKFQVIGGGLGRVAPGEDHVSAIVFTIAAPPALGTTKIKEYRDLLSAVADGITEASATYGIVYYQMSEFFRLAAGASLFVCFTPTNLAADLLAATAGKVRQVGVFFSDFATLGSVYQAAANTLDGQQAPCVFVAGYDGTTVLNLTSAADLGATQTAPNVAVLIAGSGSGKSAALATALGKTYIPAVGTVLGALASAEVHECVAWVEKFNLSDGAENEVIRLADGTNNPSYATLDALNSKRYLVFRKHIGRAGTYLNDSYTAVPATNDYAFLESSRVMGKVKREVRKQLLPDLNSPLTVDAITGKLSPGTTKYFEVKCGRSLTTMQGAGEISGFGVYINPDQDVLATSVLQIQIKIVPRGVARNIVVQLGFAVSLK